MIRRPGPASRPRAPGRTPGALRCALAFLACAAPSYALGDMTTAVAHVNPAVVTLRAGRSTGAGFVINEQGQIVTNAHVVANARSVEARFSDGRTDTASVLAVDQRRDLALLQVKAPCKTWVQFGSASKAKLAEDVAAIGAPLGLENTITKGVLSSRERLIGSQRMLQIDAALNPGNSGGPVIDSRGSVIGVSTVVAARAQNVGFAVPSEVVVGFLREQGAKFESYPGDSLEAEAVSQSATPKAGAPASPPAGAGPPPPAGQQVPLSLPVTIAIAAVVSALVSALVTLLVLRLMLHRATQIVPGRAVRHAGPAPHEDLSDIDITLS